MPDCDAKTLDADIPVNQRVTTVAHDGDLCTVTTDSGETFTAPRIVVATGRFGSPMTASATSASNGDAASPPRHDAESAGTPSTSSRSGTGKRAFELLDVQRCSTMSTRVHAALDQLDRPDRETSDGSVVANGAVAQFVACR